MKISEIIELWLAAATILCETVLTNGAIFGILFRWTGKNCLAVSGGLAAVPRMAPYVR